MTAATLTLTEFLLACIAEDEEVARDAAITVGSEGFGEERIRHGAEWVPSYHRVVRIRLTSADPKVTVADCGDFHGLAPAKHVARHDPARVLAECEAKRRIVEEHRLITDPDRLVKVWRDPTPGVACERCAGDPLGDRPLEDIGPCDTLRALALPYADRPGYRQEWRP